MFWDKIRKRLKKSGFNVTVKDDDVRVTEKEGDTHCPSGGMAVNVKCAGCGLWFNNTPFGLDFIGIKDNIGEHKMLRWYCPHCNTIDTTELKRKDITDALSRLYIDKHTPIVTPFHRSANRIKERRNRHGSCGNPT